MRLAALLLCLISTASDGFVGAFPVCYKGAQYVRIELVKDGFAPVDCALEAARQGDPRLLLLATLGVFALTCADIRPDGTVRLHIDPMNTADSVLGHELRHAFPPNHSHPYVLPWLSSPC